jgi:hypothetical protein
MKEKIRFWLLFSQGRWDSRASSQNGLPLACDRDVTEGARGN